jgi:hypothetical protein
MGNDSFQTWVFGELIRLVERALKIEFETVQHELVVSVVVSGRNSKYLNPQRQSCSLSPKLFSTGTGSLQHDMSVCFLRAA